MKKKLLALVFSAVMVMSLAACGGSKADFTNDDLIFKGSEEIVLKRNTGIFIWPDETYYQDTHTGEYDGWEEDFATFRGLEIGMSLADFKKQYSIKNGYAVWELIDGSYTSFDAYTNQNISNMYDDAENVWLDLGWCKENGNWRIMTDVEFRDTWFCDASLSKYDEIVFLSVNIDEDETVVGIQMYYVTYDEDWVTWQGWAD